ncbi:copper oxidase [Pacificitalea manganoxidans]|uniref:Copper oxidase n=1 Tax=Pacificitalea manganoxidans TaxID=1411902 RepID=A0A291LXE2_9RHOB|nr:multicopper oxidase family protein [Pacificitalea manganoxidans]ATI41361.1 copper oxidase [Pacificitalea manganoxidans]MDR6308766.1 FtsP/CotA-like multicopper oxidase with cupredoxin domain [Pacificitalea manganoxidans]
MMTTRRDFLIRSGATLATAATTAATTAAMTGLPRLARAATAGLPELRAQKAQVQLAPEGYPQTAIWGYGGALPGPELRLAQGARVQRRFVNDLPQASTVHWHGVRLDNAMDGVPGLTQAAVAPGDGFDYDFTAGDAGTFWYHAHERSVEQVARGLYGALVVEEAEAPDVDADLVLVLDDWLLDPETAQIDTDFEAPHDRSHAGRRGNFVATNGQQAYSRDVATHDRLRLRLINAANARIFVLDVAGMEGWTIALDGMPLPAPTPLTEPVLLGPGQRADLIVDITAEPGEVAQLLRFDSRDGVSQAGFPVTGQSARSRRPAPAALPPNPRMGVTLDADTAALRLNMEGGAMGRLDAAILNGTRRTFRELVEANEFWSFNGVVGMPDAPLATLARGQTATLEIRNDTAFPHAMHLHGMHFRELDDTGAATGPLRDTLLMAGGETRSIGFTADNPGDWMFHCHMLSHAASGMMTWLRVA